MYDPKTRRFLTEDPRDFAAGDYNLYRYVGNNPTNETDPSGLQPPATKNGGKVINIGPGPADRDRIQLWQFGYETKEGGSYIYGVIYDGHDHGQLFGKCRPPHGINIPIYYTQKHKDGTFSYTKIEWINIGAKSPEDQLKVQHEIDDAIKKNLNNPEAQRKAVEEILEKRKDKLDTNTRTDYTWLPPKTGDPKKEDPKKDEKPKMWPDDDKEKPPIPPRDNARKTPKNGVVPLEEQLRLSLFASCLGSRSITKLKTQAHVG